MGDDICKKELEREVLEYFNPIYKIVTHDFLEVIEESERPDFICKRKNGELVGVEIVQARRGHPDDIFFEKVINKNINMSPDKAIDIIQTLIYEKEQKRKTLNWQLPDNTILIVQLKESPLWEIAEAMTEDFFPDLPSYGFCEIWLADFSKIDAFNNIELSCLYPQNLSGYYKRPMQKPYG